MWPWEIKMFSDFKSRCKIDFLWRYSSPLTISRIQNKFMGFSFYLRQIILTVMVRRNYIWKGQVNSKIKRGASSRWSFRPNSAWGSIETATIGKTHPTVQIWLTICEAFDGMYIQSADEVDMSAFMITDWSQKLNLELLRSVFELLAMICNHSWGLRLRKIRK